MTLPPYLFDGWSFGHIALWGALGFSMMRELSRSGGDPARDMLLCLAFGLMLGVSWELFEWTVVEPLLGFHEPLVNRWIGDPFCDLIGTLTGTGAALLMEDA